MSSGITKVTKIQAIKPGEKIILPKGAKILKTIVTNGSVSSSCASQDLHIVSETTVRYALAIDWVDELGKEDELIGLGFNGQEFLFPSTIPFHQDMKVFSNGLWTNESGPCIGGIFSGDSCVAMVKVFHYMKTLLPGGDALFTFHRYVTDSWGGPSGGSGKDDMFLQGVEFFSYPSIIDSGNFYLLRRDQPGSSEYVSDYYSNSDRQLLRIYPFKVDDPA